MAMPEKPSQAQMDLVKESATALKSQAPLIAQIMYDKFWAANPDMKQLWSVDFTRRKQVPEGGCPGNSVSLQAQVQSSVVFSFMTNIEHIDRLMGDLRRVAQKHCSRNIDYNKYPLLGEALLEALVEVTGGVDQSILDAWHAGWTYLVECLAHMEKELYREMEERKNGFIGFKEFRIVSMEEIEISHAEDSDDEDEEFEKDTATIVTFEPLDGAALPAYDHNQYTCLKVVDEKLGGATHRNYYLYGDSNEKKFRLSLSKMDRSLVTAHVLDEMKVGDIACLSAPFGNYLLMETLGDNPTHAARYRKRGPAHCASLISGGIDAAFATRAVQHASSEPPGRHLVQTAAPSAPLPARHYRTHRSASQITRGHPARTRAGAELYLLHEQWVQLFRRRYDKFCQRAARNQ
ncbi:Flavohemoprotein [Porphyridium purpureum]|uniref:Flavohemoprotein n=1 Tax=Porphyridium purpureum TaxID=35688 RepID=A0A5J4YMY1_PORPP|nr:Flavohemoprotein [Porphyridium purpureum]|eukprot:POR0371..scf295_9